MIPQKQVYGDIAAGLPGMKAGQNSYNYWPNTPLAEGDVAIGTFVWPGTDPVAQATNAGEEDAEPIGLVERNIVYINMDVTAQGSDLAPEGSTLTVATQGAYWVVSATAATVGQKVFAVSADGTIKTGAAGATVTGAVETPWVVTTPGDIGEPIIITRA
ncbi:MAG: hypothetical protein LBS31_05095 [Candidatus Adiutrix sp.]|jgi:hypothetical protein|nr:hypothetical protein [Candidatus Adiutrix sp.]